MTEHTFDTQFLRLRSLSRSERAPSYAKRVQDLRKLERLLTEHGAELVSAMREDFGNRATHESETFDIVPSLAEVRTQLRGLRGFMRLTRIPVPWFLRPARARLVPQPLGVVGIISPWNFPVYLTIAPLASALAAGNRVMIKPSELVPKTSELLSRLLGQMFSEDQLGVVLGGVSAAEAFAALPFDHLLFTGSTQVGRKIAVAAAANLTPVTLELGGKSPVIVTNSADIKLSARRTMFGKLANAGQICIAPDYVLVPKDKMRAFTAELVSAAASFYPEYAGNAEYTWILTERHRERLVALREDARAQGAEVIELGSDATSSESRGRCLMPAIVLNPKPSTRIMQEEIFGPLLPVIGYDSLDQAIQHVNAGERPLALYVFATDASEREQVLTQTVSGGVTVNDVLFHCGAGTLPFGGVGASGMGAYHGETGFRTFSHLKPVFYQAPLNSGALLEPPVSPLKSAFRGWLEHLV